MNTPTHPPAIRKVDGKMAAYFLLTWTCLMMITILPVPTFGLSNVTVAIPKAVKRNNDAILGCHYDLEGAMLYSVKWYKGKYEFFRYTPQDQPPSKSFAGRGLTVDLQLSNQSHVVLSSVTPTNSGKYTCEVSMDAPSFDTVVVSGQMEVVELPAEHTVVSGVQPRYRIGDLVDGNCSIKYSKPAANLTWTINGVVVSPHHIKTYQIEKHDEHMLESVLSTLHIMATTQHFIKGQMRLKCSATIFDIFKEEIESIIEEDRPQTMASGRSHEMHPYDRSGGGDGLEDHNESYLTYYSAADTTSAAISLQSASFFMQALQQLKHEWQRI